MSKNTELSNENSYDKEKYVTVMYIAKKIGRTGERFIKELKKRLKEMNIFKSVLLPTRYHNKETNEYVEVIYLRQDVDTFFKEHLSIGKEFNSLTRSELKWLSKLVKVLKIKEYLLSGKLSHARYVKKEDCELLKIYFYNKETMPVTIKSAMKQVNPQQVSPDSTYYSKDDVTNLLQITENMYTKLVRIEVLNISFRYRKMPYFKKDEINILCKEQQKLLKDFEKHYTLVNIREKYGASFSKHFLQYQSSPIKLKNPDLIICLRNSAKWLYPNDKVDEIYSKWFIDREINIISHEDPFKEFVMKLENVMKFQFKDKQKITKELWFAFVKDALTERKGLRERINDIVRATEAIFTIIQNEIFTYTAQELNQKVLNENSIILRTYQMEFYAFLKRVLITFTKANKPLPFFEEDLNNPYYYDRFYSQQSDTYSFEEYHKLYNYVNDINYHKKRAISDVQNFLWNRDKKTYRKYDSCWLYIIVQLTNNWRHRTVLSQIPRIDLSNTNIKSLEWLSRNDPSIEDANNIIYQIGRYLTKIEKTSINAEGIFVVGEPLKVAFAIAISVCELRTQEVNDNSDTLIWLNGPLSTDAYPHKIFFDNLDEDFSFENRKINATLTTLIWSVLRHVGKGLKEAQISRLHLSEDTTIDHYIKLSDEQVNNLVDELFERNQFGYVTKLMTDILYGKSTTRPIETERISELNKVFGDVNKIEVTAGFINQLGEKRESTRAYIESLNLTELRNLYNKSVVGTLPSKQEYYQCIYSKCKFEDEFGNKPACEICPSSIINIYALTEIMDIYIDYMEKIITDFDNVKIAEKKKLSNHFDMVYKLVSDARTLFGRKVVDGFVDGETERLKNLGLQLSEKNLQSYLTAGYIDTRRKLVE